MFKNNWDASVAEKIWSDKGLSPADKDLALRIYSCRLIGAEPDLVMHGGGNTSVKTKRMDILGADRDVIHVKGSGADLDDITEAGLPGMYLEPLLALQKLQNLSDEDMINAERQCLIQSNSPNPSIETLLHAFLPHKFVEHTHSTPFLVLANLVDADFITKSIFGDEIAIVPYVIPGFDLAKLAYEIYLKDQNVKGMLLINHGHFSFGKTAEESYSRLIEQTNKVARYLGMEKKTEIGKKDIELANFLPIIRGVYSDLGGSSPISSPVFEVRSSKNIRSRLDLARFGTLGVASPDHIIRIKSKPLILQESEIRKGKIRISEEILKFVAKYEAYFERNNKASGKKKIKLDSLPRHIWIPNFGIIGVGVDKKSARAAADLSEQNLYVRSIAHKFEGFHPISEKDEFDIEYWDLEQAKLHKISRKMLSGQIAMITGAGGAIGSSIARMFVRAGAEVLLVDKNLDTLKVIAEELEAPYLAIDLCDNDAPVRCLNALEINFGGGDILVSNAGIAIRGDLHLLSEDLFDRSFDLNFEVHRKLSIQFSRMLINQGKGGQILFNISKQSVNPGKGLGSYGIPKAATLFLMKQLALELGEFGIRVNGVNADRIRSGILSDEMIASRSISRNVSETEYMTGNLLNQEVFAVDVGQAFLSLTQMDKTTAHVITVDGGNIEASLR